MPGYVLVRMEMSDRGYHMINSINRVTGFLGPQGRPMPMRDNEVNAILNRVHEGEQSIFTPRKMNKKNSEGCLTQSWFSCLRKEINSEKD